jgi:hypothetical protein
MLQDTTLMKAASSLIQRSERRVGESKIVETFVDVGILAQLENSNDQILYGRRGTGKTHVFQVLASRFQEDPKNIVVLMDGRTLGSTSQFTDTSLGLKQRCTSLFRDVLGEVHNALLDHIVNEPPEVAEPAFASLDGFSAVAVEPVRNLTEEILTGKQKDSISEKSALGISATIALDNKSAVKLNGKTTGTETTETEGSLSQTFKMEDKVLFPAVNSFLKAVLEKAEARLVILFDEWSSIPQDIQPYLAEFLKRGFMPNAMVALKIAALEYRSTFGIRTDDKFTGFEMGSDISTTLDLDDYYVFDRNPGRITQIFEDILYRHLNSELPPNYLKDTWAIDSGEKMCDGLFNNPKSFRELVRASEGVVRDFINIFGTAYFDSQRRGRKNIELKSIVEAGRQWFEKDKHENLDDNLRAVLRRIVEDVIAHRRARSFLVERELGRHPAVQKLFDSRVLHLVQRGYADKDNPGRRYNIYTLDYGTYVDLINTSKQPELDMPEIDLPDEERIVPFDDKRSIRRIILTQDVLEA